MAVQVNQLLQALPRVARPVAIDRWLPELRIELLDPILKGVD